MNNSVKPFNWCSEHLLSYCRTVIINNRQGKIFDRVITDIDDSKKLFQNNICGMQAITNLISERSFLFEQIWQLNDSPLLRDIIEEI